MSNLIYIFLSDKFLQTGETCKSDWSYNNLPDYYIDTFTYNSKKFNNSYIIAEKEQIIKYKNQFPTHTKFIDVQEIVETNNFKEVQDIILSKWYRYYKNTFWYVTFIRIIILSIFVKKYNLTNSIHIEADNIIFANDFTKLFELLQPADFGFSNEAPHASAPALIAFKDAAAGDNLLKKHLILLKKGDTLLYPYVGHFAGHVTDMAFLDIIYRNNKNYKMLPCLPYGDHSENFKQLQTVFDPISYSHFLNGTNQGHPSGYTEKRHYVGREIIDNNIKVLFDKKPYIIYNSIQIPIFNLHVHNKKAIKPLLKNVNC